MWALRSVLTGRLSGVWGGFVQPLACQLHVARSATTAADNLKSRPGLFGVPGLHQPSDFGRMQVETRARCDDLVASILSAPPDASVVGYMDDMSDALCRCYDAAEACRNIHDDPTWRAAATRVCMELGAYISEVNHHRGLYTALASALQAHDDQQAAMSAAGGRSDSVDGGVGGGWTREAVVVGRALVRDMQQAGIHLPSKAQRERMQALMNDNAHYGAQFNAALRDPRQLGAVRVEGSSGQDGGGMVKRLWGRKGSELVPLDPASVARVMGTEKDEDVRRQVWMASARTPASNVALLESMCAARHEMAITVGEPSYAHYKAASGSLARDPAAVVAFLRQLGEGVKPLADQEVQRLASMRSRVGFSAGSGSSAVMPWDVDQLSSAARTAAADACGGAVPRRALDQYTHLPSVLRGLSELVGRVLGITLDMAPAPPGEAWAAGVIRCEASHPDLGFLGTVYLDLCSRAGKYPSAVTFPIRCGKALPGEQYQAPIMALLADFGAPGCKPEQVFLSMRELRVLVHEMGHCVHNLASRTTYQHLWGTRCAQDLVEVPSHLFEHWACHPASLGVLARHAGTGEPLPPAMVAPLTAAREALAALELQQQVLLALVDQRYFGEQRVATGATGEAWGEACQGLASVPYIPGTHPEARMGHLTIYGATYYSYTYARCLSSAIWNKLLAHDPLDPGAGALVVEKLLAPGGAVDPGELMEDLLGSGALQVVGHGRAPRTDGILLRTAMTTFA